MPPFISFMYIDSAASLPVHAYASRHALWRFGFVPSTFKNCIIMSPDEFTPSYWVGAQPSLSHTLWHGRLNRYMYNQFCRYFFHSLVGLLDINASAYFFHTALENWMGITGYYISISVKALSRLCERRGAISINILDEFAFLARSTFNQAVNSDTKISYCPMIYLPAHDTFWIVATFYIMHTYSFSPQFL